MRVRIGSHDDGYIVCVVTIIMIVIVMTAIVVDVGFEI